MDPTVKPQSRKRLIVGWRQVARRTAENRSRHRTPPTPLAKRES